MNNATLVKGNKEVVKITFVKRYTIMRSANTKVLSTDILSLAEDAIREIGGTSYIKFNNPWIGDTRHA